MQTYNLAVLTKRIHDSSLEFFTTDNLRSVLKIENRSSLFNVIHRLVHAQVLTRIERNKYVLHSFKGSDFALAHFLYQPSYVSFESALSFYGVLSQFPTEVTSATLKLPRIKTWTDKQFSYVRLKKDLFWGYLKQDDYLIAEPEKALLDQIYIATKGGKSLTLDEYDFSQVRKKKLADYVRQFPRTRQFLSGVQQLQEYL